MTLKIPHSSTAVMLSESASQKMASRWWHHFFTIGSLPLILCTSNMILSSPSSSIHVDGLDTAAEGDDHYGSHDDHTSHHGHHSDQYGQVLIFFLSIGLCFGAVTDFMLSRFGIKIAYNVVMFFEGILFGFLLNNSELQSFTTSMESWSNIPPYLLMYVFLPILTFSDALEMPWYYTCSTRIEVKHIYAQSIMFGIPVVVLITITLAAVVKSFTDWSWALSLLFGSCMAATDPVSVLPVMRTTGASHAVTILVLGESLLSEGAATVLFHVFERKIEGQSYNFFEILQLVVGEFIFSIAFGILGGLVTVKLMSFANQHLRSQDSILQVAICIVCAYFIFFYAQSLLELSGVLSTCTAAVYVASFAQGVILNHHTFHSVWALFEWAGQTLIFLFAGFILKDITRSNVQWSHIPKVLALYLVMVAVRATYILLTYKFAGSVSGHKISFKEAFFFGFTGLKGAVGMILSLVGFGLAEMGYIDDNDGNDFIVLSSLLITFSMFLGGTLTRYLIKGVGLRPKDTPESLIVKRYIRSKVRVDVMKEYEVVKEQFANVDISSLMEFSGLLQSEFDDSLHLELDAQLLRTTLSNTFDPSRNLNPLLLTQLRMWYLNSVKAGYFHHIAIGRLPRHSYSAQLLLQSINATLDNEDPTILGDFEVVLDGLTLNPYLRYFLEVLVVPVTTFFKQSWNPIAWLQAQQAKRSAYTWSSFCLAHQHAASIISEFLNEERETFHGQSSSRQIPEVTLLLQQSKESITRATNLLNLIESSELKKIYENQAAKMLLNKEASIISHLAHEGMITIHDSEIVLKRINTELNNIEQLRKAHSRKLISKYRKRGADIEIIGEERFLPVEIQRENHP